MFTRLRRDLVLDSLAVAGLVFEIGWGGGRASVITALIGVLLAPIPLRADEARRRRNNKTNAAC